MTTTQVRPRLLLIDDSPANLRTLAAGLGPDFEIHFAVSGGQGLEMAGDLRPDLILLDIMMPDMDGHDVCRRLKADPALKRVPVIFVTALTTPEEESAGLALGAADYLTKPVNLEIARLRINGLLERERLRREIETHRDHLEDLVRVRTEALQIAKEAAEASDRAKSAFLGTISHELRTPLNGIIGFADIAARKVTDPKVVDYLVRIGQSGKRLAALVNDVLEYSDLEANRLTLEPVHFMIGDLLDEMDRLFRTEAMQKDLHLAIDCAPDIAELAVIGDRKRVGQVIQAIIANAIKFTDAGSVRVRVAKAAETAADIRLRIEVEDTGIGISEADQRRLFHPFVQADASNTRKYAGAGLCLAICWHLVKLMHGELGVESRPGEGSRFRIEVRLDRAPASGLP